MYDKHVKPWRLVLLLLAVLLLVEATVCEAKPQPVTRQEYEAFTKARKYLADDRTDDASKLMQRYFRREGKKHSLGYELYGYILMSQKRTRKAVEVFEEGFSYYPKNASIAQNLGAAYGRSEDYGRAAQLFYTAYNLYEERKPNLAYTASYFHYRDKSYDKAVEILKSLVVLPEAKPMMHMLLAKCYLEKKAFKSARITLKRGVDIFPEEPQMWRLLGFTYHQLGDTNRAVATYEIAYRLKPASDKEVKQLIGLYASIGAPHMGDVHVDNGSLLDAKVLDNLAYGLARSGDLEEALEKADKALVMEPTDLRQFRRGVLLMRMGRAEDARKVFEALGNVKGKIGGKANWALAMMSWTESQWLDVLLYLDRAAKADPKLKKRSRRLEKIVESVLESPA